MKKYALSGLIVFLLVAAIFAAGCMVSEKNNSSTQIPSTMTSTATARTSSPSSSGTTTSRDATVEKFVDETHNELMKKDYNLQTWDVKWLNNTMVKMTYSVKLNAGSAVLTLDQTKTLLRLKSTEAATAYLDSLDRAGYEQSKETYPGGGFYDKAVGHNPTVFRMYQKQSDSKVYSLAQLDDTILYAETSVTKG